MILFGGTFDPVHRGHLQAALYAGELLAHSVHLLLAPRPRLRQPSTASYADRWAMLQLACQPYTILVPFDFERNAPGPTHTIVTLERLRQSTSDCFVWLLGSDALRKVHLWYRAEELPQWLSFLVVKRPGDNVVPPPRNFHAVEDVCELLERPGTVYTAAQPMLDLSATTVRHHLEQGRDIKYLVSPPVYDYIISRHIYEPKDSC